MIDRILSGLRIAAAVAETAITLASVYIALRRQIKSQRRQEKKE